QAAGFGTVNLLSFSSKAAPPTAGPRTQTTFPFNPRLPPYKIENLPIAMLNEGGAMPPSLAKTPADQPLLALDQERGTRARVGFLVNQPRTFGISSRVKFH